MCDYYRAVEDGLIPPGYRVWWGFEDKYLYKYAKRKLTKLSAEGKPFCLVMTTLDTHMTGGYLCDLCPKIYERQLENVVKCADSQITEFVRWLKAQPFYENSTVVIVGDHCSMEPDFFDNLPKSYVRRPYNVFLNSAAPPEGREKERIFTTLDYYPTILASLGVKIEGERLGLGTNLFSKESTLAEKLGISRLRSELAKRSDYYNEHILYGRD